MKFEKSVILKNGEECLIRQCTASDGADVLQNFNRAHAETDFLLTYPDENHFTEEQEAAFLKEKEDSADEIELAAFVGGKLAGTAGIESVGRKDKAKHRAEFGISILKDFWGLGIGTALLEACILCAKEAGYTQLELDAVAENTRALALYEKAGFIEYGRNPRGFRTRTGRYQALVLMRKELE